MSEGKRKELKNLLTQTRAPTTLSRTDLVSQRKSYLIDFKEEVTKRIPITLFEDNVDLVAYMLRKNIDRLPFVKADPIARAADLQKMQIAEYAFITPILNHLDALKNDGETIPPQCYNMRLWFFCIEDTIKEILPENDVRIVMIQPAEEIKTIVFATLSWMGATMNKLGKKNLTKVWGKTQILSFKNTIVNGEQQKPSETLEVKMVQISFKGEYEDRESLRREVEDAGVQFSYLINFRKNLEIKSNNTLSSSLIKEMDCLLDKIMPYVGPTHQKKLRRRRLGVIAGIIEQAMNTSYQNKYADINIPFSLPDEGIDTPITKKETGFKSEITKAVVAKLKSPEPEKTDDEVAKDAIAQLMSAKNKEAAKRATGKAEMLIEMKPGSSLEAKLEKSQGSKTFDYEDGLVFLKTFLKGMVFKSLKRIYIDGETKQLVLEQPEGTWDGFYEFVTKDGSLEIRGYPEPGVGRDI
jgi:hypothetical protein